MKFTSKEQYINYVKDAAIKIGNKYHYPVSLLLSQACLENGYGLDPTCQSLVDHMNFLGMKAELLNDSWDKYSVWGGKSFVKNTPEVYNGREVRIDDAFRIYDSVEQCFEDYCLFMKYGSNYGLGGTPKYGNKVLGVGDPETVITRVMNIGYCTGKTYASSNMRIIREWNLTQYDDPALAKTVSKTSTTKKTTTTSNVKKLADRKINDITAENKGQVPASRGGNSIQFIVVHYLGVPNADNPYLYGGGYGGHYNIQRDGQIFKAADPKTAVVWQCGGSLQGSGGHQFHRICTNYNSIGIECGVCYTENVKDADGDSNKWYFTEETQESLVYLVSKLMDEYGISMDHVIRHYDVTGKICPNPYVKNNNLRTSWTWDQFKANLAQYRKNGTITVPNGSSSTSSSTPTSTSTTTRSFLTKGDKGDAVKTMQKMLVACGYSVGDSGIDGDFGKATDNAVRRFQSDHNLSVDGDYGPKTKAALEAAYKAKSTTTELTEIWLNEVKKVADTARTNKWTYGNSTTNKPCEDKKISCDRLVARALYNLGCTTQPKGGITCGHMETYLPMFGFTKVTKKSQIKPGAIVAVKKKTQNYINHVFVVKSYNATNDTCVKYDTGSQTRIQTVQPFKNAKLVEWDDREFVCAWNLPKKFTVKKTEKKTETKKFVHNGLDYSPIFDPTFYANKYPDLKKAFGTDATKLWNHFQEYGMKEARQASANFNVEKYKARYKDLRNAFGNKWPLYYRHYIEFGRSEGRVGK